MLTTRYAYYKLCLLEYRHDEGAHAIVDLLKLFPR